MRIHTLNILIIILFLSSCGTPKNTVILDIDKPVIINFSNNDSYIIIENVRINNDLNNRNLIFDTGSNGTVIDISVANDLNLATVGKTRLIDITGKKIRVPYVKIDSINISGAIFRNIYALITDLSMYACEGVGIILGNNVLKKGTWLIDLSANSITLFDRDEYFDFSGYQTIPFSYRVNLIKVKCELDNKKYSNFLFDTGNPTDCILLKEKDRDNFSTAPHSQWKFLYRSINNPKPDTLSREYFLLPDFKFNSSTTLDSVYVRFQRKRSIGLGLFKDNQLVIDYKNKIIGIKNNLSQPDSARKSIGIAFNSFDKNSVIVSGIKLESVADNNGIMLGDTIELVNNLRADKTNVDYCALLDSINSQIFDTLYLKTKKRLDLITLIPE
jgi:predicted aspartyl protease